MFVALAQGGVLLILTLSTLFPAAAVTAQDYHQRPSSVCARGGGSCVFDMANAAPHAHTPLSLSANDSESAGLGLSDGVYGAKHDDTKSPQQQDDNKFPCEATRQNQVPAHAAWSRSIISTLLYFVLFVEIMLVIVAVINGIVSGEITGDLIYTPPPLCKKKDRVQNTHNVYTLTLA